jgi:hypothetical protein
MRIYDCIADCLVDDILLHYYVKAKNIREAWIKGYIHYNNCSVADGGSVDCIRVKDYSKIDKVN